MIVAVHQFFVGHGIVEELIDAADVHGAFDLAKLIHGDVETLQTGVQLRFVLVFLSHFQGVLRQKRGKQAIRLPVILPLVQR